MDSYMFDNSEYMLASNHPAKSFKTIPKSHILTKLKIKRESTQRVQFISNLNFPNLETLIVESSVQNQDILCKASQIYSNNLLESSKLILYPKENHRFTLKNCKFPNLRTLRICDPCIVDAIVDCDLRNLNDLNIPNNFMMLLKDNNLEKLYNLRIFKKLETKNITHPEDFSNKQHLSKSEPQIVEFDLDLTFSSVSFCKRYTLPLETIRRFPALIIQNVNMKSLKSLKIPHVNSLISANFDNSVLQSLDVEIP